MLFIKNGYNLIYHELVAKHLNKCNAAILVVVCYKFVRLATQHNENQLLII
jgi:hypothetical protein